MERLQFTNLNNLPLVLTPMDIAAVGTGYFPQHSLRSDTQRGLPSFSSGEAVQGEPGAFFDLA